MAQQPRPTEMWKKQQSAGNERRFLLIACRVLWREFNYYSAQSPHDIAIVYLEQGLHDEPDRLRACVQDEIQRASGKPFDAVLLGYGLCSNGIVGLRADSARLVVPRAHDCITFLLGSKERYRAWFDEQPGTYWYSPGWIDCCEMPGPERLARIRREYVEKYGEENAEYLIERTEQWMTNYNKVAYVDFGFSDTTAPREFARHCAEGLGWDYEEVPGDPTLIRRLVNGDWPNEDFLVVEPGQEIAGDYSSPTVIRTK